MTLPRRKPMPRPSKPLERGAQLKRTELKRGESVLRSVQRIKPVSKKQRARQKEVAVARERLVEFYGAWCQVRSPVCTGREQGVHHLCKRSQGGCDHLHNLKLACNPCNGFIEDQPAWAKQAGLVHRRPPCAAAESGKGAAA